MGEPTNLYQRRKLQALSARTGVIDDFEDEQARQHAITLAGIDALRLVLSLEPVGDRSE